MNPQFLELFCGTKVMAKAFREQGFETLTLDNAKKFKPDMCIDILEFDRSILPLGFNPDVIWASPPCQGFTIICVGHNWTKIKGTAIPISKRAVHALSMVKKTLEIIRELQPHYWFIENPRAMLRVQSIMEGLPRRTITYCQYGERRMKPTDIWTNCAAWIPRPACRNGAPCHESAPRGWPTTGTLGVDNPVERAKIPRELCKEIAATCARRLYEQSDKG